MKKRKGSSVFNKLNYYPKCGVTTDWVPLSLAPIG